MHTKGEQAFNTLMQGLDRPERTHTISPDKVYELCDHDALGSGTTVLLCDTTA